MEILIIIGVLVVLAFLVTGAQVGLTAKTASTGGNAFAAAYKQEYGATPPPAATSAISSGMGIIASFCGAGKDALGRERLDGVIRDYGAAVNWDESKMELGLGCLLACCANRKGEPGPGTGWAIDVIMHHMSISCPSLVDRAYRSAGW